MDALGGVIGLVFLVALYLLPAIVAHTRKHRNYNGILLLNLFLGWTLIGWLAALIWAVYRRVDEAAPGQQG